MQSSNPEEPETVPTEYSVVSRRNDCGSMSLISIKEHESMYKMGPSGYGRLRVRILGFLRLFYATFTFLLFPANIVLK